MKTALLFLFAIVLVNASKYEDLKLRHKFNEFVVKFNKKYTDQEEFNDRLKVFTQNLKDIENHNARHDQTWTKGINQFTDLTGNYFSNQM
jgi:hypothetical protein